MWISVISRCGETGAVTRTSLPAPSRLRRFGARRHCWRGGLLVDLQRVVEAVEEAAERDAQGELDDLGLAEAGAQAIEERLADALRVVGDGDRVLDDEAIDIVELGMVAVVEDAIGALGGQAFDHQHRLVMGDAVVTFVELRDGDDRKLEMAALDRAALAQIEQQAHEMLDRRRRVGKDRDLIAERPIAGDEPLADLACLLRQLRGVDIAHPRHFASFTYDKGIAIFSSHYAESSG